MDVFYLTPEGVERHGVDGLVTLLARRDGFVWVDIPECDDEATTVLADVFGFHPMAIAECRSRNHVPTVHGYADHLFVVTHVPALGGTGHVHLLELDQFVGERYLVTVHGLSGRRTARRRTRLRPQRPESAPTRDVAGRIHVDEVDTDLAGQRRRSGADLHRRGRARLGP